LFGKDQVEEIIDIKQHKGKQGDQQQIRRSMLFDAVVPDI